MKFDYKKEANIEVGQKLYGVIASSIYTYDGVYSVVVHNIDYNNEEVIFEVEQPCGLVSCTFREMEDFVFDNEKEAKDVMYNLEYGEGLCAYSYY